MTSSVIREAMSEGQTAVTRAIHGIQSHKQFDTAEC